MNDLRKLSDTIWAAREQLSLVRGKADRLLAEGQITKVHQLHDAIERAYDLAVDLRPACGPVRGE